jgi:hypothetical protein
MSVGKISGWCWGVFGVMCVAFLPLGYGATRLTSLPVAVRAALVVLVCAGLWWGPFVYAMYLSMAVMRNGDRRLLKRGVRGTARIVHARQTSTVIQAGEFAWQAPYVWKYRLIVTVPGKDPYETDCSICISGLQPGQTVKVAVSPHNRKRVTIDVGQGAAGKRGEAGQGATYPISNVASTRYLNPAASNSAASNWAASNSATSDQARLDALAQLGQLHEQGVLTDAEFTAQKAHILSEP